MMREIRFGIIGCGLMGREFASAAARWLHLTGMRARPRIVAVCDTNPALMGWYTDALGPMQVTTDYRDLLANAEVEAVYCAVPHVLHAEIYPAILAAGKHLLGEKPFGMDLAQNRAISAAIAARPDLLVRCSSEMPFYPGAQKVVEFVRSGAVGPVLEVEACFLHSSDINPEKPINWKRMAGVNGDYGCMGDLGMHVLHVPLRLGWRPARVTASLVKRVETRPDGKGGRVACDTWDNATITCTVPDAAGDFPMVLKTWRIAPGEANTWSIRVLGMKGSAVFTTKSPRQWQWMRYEAGGSQGWVTEDLGYTPLFGAITGGIFEFGFTDAIQQMWAAFVDELAGGDAQGFPCATPEEAAAHHAVLTAALQAGTSGQSVEVCW
ncbi:Gfo/Idh/MocA family oxidoreductase [Rhodobacter sp. HX-7-19]|uniref:Gfo/Idh/MocA family oxidoreductase n=1 Tax=Paragemmobacter kunshanensis TaxID=2583234 RepID=A0A6M1TQT6_9RHOB|nr:Gfo/Idh/MocA family oxidoreductase [Rhodobacter kunshanensis]NGQ90588.1 Gfo/Idh/MocA family oxidoreductase [Rhodobacter kunshanensis]